MVNIKIDPFTLFIGNVESTEITENLLNIQISNVSGNIYVLNFSSIGTKKLNITDDSKIIFEEMPLKNIKYIKDFIQDLKAEDGLVVLGGERLVNYSDNLPIIKKEFFDVENKMHFLESEDWESFVDEVEELFQTALNEISACFILLIADGNTRERINELSKSKENFSIMCFEYGSDNSFELENLQRALIHKISKLSIADALKVIDDNRDKLGDRTADYFCAIAYINNGAITEAIATLEKHVTTLENVQKLILVDLYTQILEFDKAENILNELFQSDRYLNGLLEAAFRFMNKSDRFDKKEWLDIAQKIDSNNPAVIEFSGSYYSREGDYKKAAIKFRELRDIHENSDYYELVARMNDILGDSYSENEAIAYIEELLIEFPNLKTEAYKRLMNYLIKHKNSPYAAYSIANKVDLNNMNSNVVHIIKQKLEILKDVKLAARALGKIKPFSSKKVDHKIYLMKERTKALIESIPILANDNTGYLIWRDYISSQNNEVWIFSLHKGILEMLLDGGTLVSDLTKDSYINKIEGISLSNLNRIFSEIESEDLSIKNKMEPASILLLRGLRDGKVRLKETFESIGEMIEVVLKSGEFIESKEHSLWSKYYLSINLSLLGEHQKANEIALTIFEYKKMMGKEYESLGILLGIIAWGNSQFRLGNEVEGIACLLAAYRFNQLKELNIYEPFLEEGTAMLTRFFNNHTEFLNNEDDLVIIKNYCEKIAPYGESLKDLILVRTQQDQDRIKELEINISESDYQDSNWIRDIIVLFNSYLTDNQGVKALELVEKYFGEIYIELENRLDIRADILSSFADAYFKVKPIQENFIKAIYYYELALEDLKKRKNVSHKEERSNISEKFIGTVRDYIEICALIYGSRDTEESLKGMMYTKILNAIPLLTPSSIIEQKSYNLNKELTKEMIDLDNKLKILKEEFARLYANNSPESELIISKGKEIAEITMVLKKFHPYHQELPHIQNTSIIDLQNNLNEDEIFSQVIITNLSIIILLVVKHEIQIHVKLVPESEIIFEEFSKEVQKKSSSKIKELNEAISLLIGRELIRELSIKSYNTLYVCLDYRMGLYPINSIEISGIILIDKVKSIINIMDHSIVGNRRESPIHTKGQIANRILGNNADNNLIKISHWLLENENENFIALANVSDEIQTLTEQLKDLDVSLLILYGHGISDPNSTITTGAIGIEGKTKLIELEKLLEELPDIDSLILISCSGGTLNNIHPEKSSGVWTTILEKFEGNIVSCKWDVPTKPTIFIMNELINILREDNLKLSESLLLAQKRAKKECANIAEWAGLQFWMN